MITDKKEIEHMVKTKDKSLLGKLVILPYVNENGEKIPILVGVIKGFSKEGLEIKFVDDILEKDVNKKEVIFDYRQPYSN